METHETQPGMTPGSYWNFWKTLPAKSQERILKATIREALADEPRPDRAPEQANLNIETK
jgi:hypothetical protein